MDTPPLDDERWQALVRAVLAAEADEPRRLDGVLDLREPARVQGTTDEPSGRRSSTSS